MTGLFNDSLCPGCYFPQDIYYNLLNPSESKVTNIKYGLDIANHVNKGVYAIRFDGVEHFYLKNIKISKIINKSKDSQVPNKVVSAEVSHRKRYTGIDSYGMILSNCKIGYLNSQLKNIASKEGQASGLVIQHHCKNIDGHIKTKFIKGKMGQTQMIISKNSEGIIKVE